MRRRVGRTDRPVVAVVVALFVVLVGALSLVVVRGGSKDGSSQVVRLGDAIGLPPPVGVTNLSIPVPVRSDAKAWTGEELLLFGGDFGPGSEANFGATFRPATGEWTTWPEAPFDPPVAGSAGVWTGSEFVVVGQSCENRASFPDDDQARCYPGTLAAAAFDPVSLTWRSLPAPPDPTGRLGEGSDVGFGHSTGWVRGHAVFAVGTDLIAYVPDQNEWKVLPTTNLNLSVAYRCGVGASAKTPCW
jgi:hypothetical protein